MFFKRKAHPQLDPYQVGKVAGPAAFSAGDRVVICKDNNAPGRVRCLNPDVGQSICVILGDPSEDNVYGETNYFAADLGYPLHQELWSAHQKEWYQRCHSEQWLQQRWQG